MINLETRDVGVAIAIVALAMTATTTFLRAGVLVGKHDEFSSATNKRLARLEEVVLHQITREEMDARFREMHTAIAGVTALLRQQQAPLGNRRHGGGGE